MAVPLSSSSPRKVEWDICLREYCMLAKRSLRYRSSWVTKLDFIGCLLLLLKGLEMLLLFIYDININKKD